MAVDDATTLFITLLAIGVISWGYFRARAYGKYGVLAWMQSLVLMAPWILFFGLFSLGIYINFIAILLLFLISTGIYIYLGRKLRDMSKSQILQDRLNRLLNTTTDSANASEDKRTEGENAPTLPPEVKVPLPFPQINPIPLEDLKQIQNIFGIDTFFCTDAIPYQEGAICKGNLRGQPDEVHQRLSTKLKDLLNDRYRLFLVEGTEEKPVVIILPQKNDPKPLGIAQQILALVLVLATGVTTLERGGLQYGFDLFEHPEQVQQVLPLSLGLGFILLAHELGHWLMARRYQIRLSWPFWIPAWQLGSFGAITRFESLIPNRSILFDITFAGPATSGLLSLVCLILGLILPAGPFAIQLPTTFFQGSLLVGTLARGILGTQIQAAVLPLHPLFIVGWLGLVITALNLVPAGQLDGGRIIQAIYGRRMVGPTTIVSLILLVIASFANPLALYWAILVVFLQRQPERPSLEELSEPDDTRSVLGLLILLLMLVTLLPLTPSLADRFGLTSPSPILPL